MAKELTQLEEEFDKEFVDNSQPNVEPIQFLEGTYGNGTN